MSNYKILFVDDEPNVTAALKRSLRREPYVVLRAESAEEAMKILADQAIDVVVSDEQMPGVSGSEFLSVVRRQYPRTIRMILTGQASLDAAIRAINDGGVYRFFTKPCSEVDLKITIRQALQQRDLVQQSSRLAQEFQKQRAVLKELERENPGLTQLKTDDAGAILVEEIEAELDVFLEKMGIRHDAGGSDRKPAEDGAECPELAQSSTR